ncbi:MAG: DNA polymerase III subunit delta' C-terminal domain-containing protein [Sedimentisphaerales bacterium]
MNFSDIFCQDRAINTLQRAFAAERIPHAYIFAGPEGVGKFTTALVWAKLLLCKTPVKKKDFADSCGKLASVKPGEAGCDSCKNIQADSHPDFHHIYKELIRFTKDPRNRNKTPTELQIDVIREFVIEKVQIKPSLSASKVFVISEAEKLNTESQNALLKTLEEPPQESFIILLCTKLDNLLPTTRSRCQIVNFGPISEEKIIASLAAAGANKQEAKFWARLTAGSIGRAGLFAKLEPSFYGVKKELLQRLSSSRLSDTIDFAQWINTTASQLTQSWNELKGDISKSDINRQAKKAIISIIISALDDAMKVKFAQSAEMINFDQPQQIKALAERFEPLRCSELIEDCFRTNRFIDAPVNEKLIFEHLLLNFANSAMMKV